MAEEFKVGDIVVLVDGPTWKFNRQYIGEETVVLSVPDDPSNFDDRRLFNGLWIPAGCYAVAMSGLPGGFFGVIQQQLRKKPPRQDPMSLEKLKELYGIKETAHG